MTLFGTKWWTCARQQIRPPFGQVGRLGARELPGRLESEFGPTLYFPIPKNRVLVH